MSTTTAMTSRERVNAAFEGKDQDRVPRHETFWAETIERWQGEGLEGDTQTVLEMLRGDFCGVGWNWPGIYPEQIVLEEDEETVVTRDGNGRTARWWKHRAGTPEHIGFECNTKEAWETKFKPMVLERGPQVDVPRLLKEYEQAQQSGRWLHLTGVEPFEVTRAIIGDEDFAIGIALEPEWIADVSETFTDRILADYQLCLDAGMVFDGLWTYGDMAYNHATFCSPQMYKDIIWPQHKRLVDFAHQNGMKFIYHTDGDVNGVMDLYLEAGFDALQPLEAKANMDVRKLCPQYGEDLTFFGNIDVMVMATNDRDKIEHELLTKLKAGMQTQRYIYHSDHSVPPTTSLETYQFIIELLDQHGNY